MSRPIVLHTEVEVPSNSDSEAPAGPMMNASGEAVEIHAFKFSLRPSNKAIEQLSYDLNVRPVSGGQFGVALTIKDADDKGYALTRGPIPLWSFGPAMGIGDEVALNLAGVFAAAPIRLAVAPVATYIWKLDHPLYLPANARIVPVFRSVGNFTFDVVAGMSAIGKTVEHSGKQHTYRVPWVSSFISSSYNFNDVQTEESNAKALQNPNDKPVHIERVTGRMLLFRDNTTTLPTSIVTDTALYMGDGGANSLNGAVLPAAEAWFNRCFKLQMSDSMGNPLVRFMTLFRSVFEPAVRSWEMKHILPPEQYLRVTLQKDNAGQTPQLAAAVNPTRAQVAITMVGWREVSWQRGGK